MPPLTSGAHCLGIGCDHAGAAREDGVPVAAPPPRRRTSPRRASRNEERRLVRRARLAEAAGLR